MGKEPFLTLFAKDRVDERACLDVNVHLVVQSRARIPSELRDETYELWGQLRSWIHCPSEKYIVSKAAGSNARRTPTSADDGREADTGESGSRTWIHATLFGIPCFQTCFFTSSCFPSYPPNLYQINGFYSDPLFSFHCRDFQYDFNMSVMPPKHVDEHLDIRRSRGDWTLLPSCESWRLAVCIWEHPS